MSSRHCWIVVLAVVFMQSARATAQGCSETSLIPPNGMLDAGDQYGWSVAVDGDVAVVGARLDDDNGFEAGAAYVFKYDGISWQYVQKLTASDGATLQLYGSDVDVSGDVIVIGAWQNTTTDSGAAYVYRYNNTTMLWDEEQKLTAGLDAVDDDFGWSVAVDGEWIVVGARTDDEAATDAGALYVFSDTGGGVWANMLKLIVMDADNGDLLGWAIDLDGDDFGEASPG